MISKRELMIDILHTYDKIDALEDLYVELEKRVKKLETKKEKQGAKKVSK